MYSAAQKDEEEDEANTNYFNLIYTIYIPYSQSYPYTYNTHYTYNTNYLYNLLSYKT